MLVGILPDSSKVEILLNNLSEADFDLNDISVIMKDMKLRNKIAKDTGPMKGIKLDQLGPQLDKAGLAVNEIALCTQAVAQGKILIVMQVAPESLSAAREMLQDHAAQIVKE